MKKNDTITKETEKGSRRGKKRNRKIRKMGGRIKEKKEMRQREIKRLGNETEEEGKRGSDRERREREMCRRNGKKKEKKKD